MSERLDRIEAEIERMLGVQRELQESQLRLLETTERNAEAIAETRELTTRNAEAISRLEQAVEGIVSVVTIHQDSIEGLNRRVDQLTNDD